MSKLYAAVALVALSAAPVFADQDLGGVLKVWPKDHGLFVVVNAQERIPSSVVEKSVERLASAFNIDVRCQKGAAPEIKEIPALISTLEAKGAIWVVDDSAYPISIAATENNWGILNVAQFSVDADDSVRDDRFAKYAMRLFANINGASDSPMMPACVMKQAVGLRGVDALQCSDYSPEAFGKVSSFLELAGYKQCLTGTYYDACEEGWAPAPTNDVQKSIWDKVHQLPTKPIRILPPSKRLDRVNVSK